MTESSINYYRTVLHGVTTHCSPRSISFIAHAVNSTEDHLHYIVYSAYCLAALYCGAARLRRNIELIKKTTDYKVILWCRVAQTTIKIYKKNDGIFMILLLQYFCNVAAILSCFHCSTILQQYYRKYCKKCFRKIT